MYLEPEFGSINGDKEGLRLVGEWRSECECGRVVGAGIARAKLELRLLARPRTPKASDGPSAGPQSGPLREFFQK